LPRGDHKLDLNRSRERGQATSELCLLTKDIQLQRHPVRL
jgi:hypothetical protein